MQLEDRRKQVLLAAEVDVQQVLVAAGRGRDPVHPRTGHTVRRELVQSSVQDPRLRQAALPLLGKSENPVVVNVSSGLGSFWAVTNPVRNESHYPAIIYSATKAAVSMLTVEYAKALPDIKFNAVEPGFTSTDLTGNGAGQTVAEGAEVIVRLAASGKDGPTSTFQENAGELAW